MTTALEQRIARVARVRGVSFNEAAAIVAKRGARKRAGLRRQEQALTRVRSAWWWARDFLD